MPGKKRKAPAPRVSKKEKLAIKKEKEEAQKIMEKYTPTIIVSVISVIFVMILGIVLKSNKIIP